MTEENIALNEIPPEEYYQKHLRPGDRQPLKTFVQQLGDGLKGRLPCGIYAVGSSTWTQVICDDHHTGFPRHYNDIDLRVVPVDKRTLDVVELAIMRELGGLKVDSRLETAPREVGNQGVYINLDYAHTIVIEHAQTLPKIELILRPKGRTNNLLSLEEELKRERNFDPERKVFAFSLLYAPKKEEEPD
ncbi:MAG: hypothetical protein NTW17_03465 [Candidatus Pacearchaeota archaeon]|nr:hypothetical protein [Candidatus Pacearchaeota archaeon]